MTVDQVAAYLQLNRLTVYRYVREGKIPAARIGKLYRIHRADVDRFLEARRVPRAPAEGLRPPTAPSGAAPQPAATPAATVPVPSRVRSVWVREFKNPKEIFVGSNRRERLADRDPVALSCDPTAVMAGIIRSLN